MNTYFLIGTILGVLAIICFFLDLNTKRGSLWLILMDLFVLGSGILTTYSFLDVGQRAVKAYSESVKEEVPEKKSTKDRLIELEDLYEQGLLTEKEYEEKRQEIIDGL